MADRIRQHLLLCLHQRRLRGLLPRHCGIPRHCLGRRLRLHGLLPMHGNLAGSRLQTVVTGLHLGLHHLRHTFVHAVCTAGDFGHGGLHDRLQGAAGRIGPFRHAILQ